MVNFVGDEALTVQYVDHMGSDLRVVEAARVSFANDGNLWDEERDVKLIKYLANHDHWTPFAHPHLTVRVAAPLSVRTQCYKHKIGLVENEISRRYVDFEPEIYIPSEFRNRAKDKKQGSEGTRKDDREIQEDIKLIATDCVLLYNDLIKRGVAPEQARFILPECTLTAWYWTGSLAAFARVVRLRDAADAQHETRIIARKIRLVLEELFPVATKALFNEKE